MLRPTVRIRQERAKPHSARQSKNLLGRSHRSWPSRPAQRTGSSPVAVDLRMWERQRKPVPSREDLKWPSGLCPVAIGIVQDAPLDILAISHSENVVVPRHAIGVNIE